MSFKCNDFDVDNNVSVYIDNLNVNIDDNTKVVLNPCFDDYLLVQMLINGYIEMTDINKTISKEFLPCDIEVISKKDGLLTDWK